MTKIQKQATAHATRIEWDCDKALEYAIALLTACNMHTEAAALEKAAKEKAEQDAKALESLIA